MIKNGVILTKEALRKLYIDEKKSSKFIAEKFGCSEHKVNYWLLAHNINKRSISEAVYAKHNPDGDPFKFTPPKNLEEAELFGLGLGLYWGEGTKANKNSIRLGNTDPKLIKKFMDFMVMFFNIDKADMHFSLQIFTDVDIKEAMDFWIKELRISRHQISKPVVTVSGSIGTYRRKSLYGVMTVMYHNKKLRDLLVGLLPNQ